MFAWLFGRKDGPEIGALYTDLVAAARAPEPYRDLGVADTFEGRFEHLALNATLMLERLAAAGNEGTALAQVLVDRIFDGLDDALRQHGVSDIAVGKRMKKLAKSFYGRIEAYRAGLAALAEGRGESDLREALARNLYGGQCAADAVPDALILRIATQRGALARADLPQLIAGNVLSRVG